MIQLRWLVVETGKRLMNEWGYYYMETERILQWTTNGVDWITVPVVEDNENKIS
jgi:hypothetical protein